MTGFPTVSYLHNALFECFKESSSSRSQQHYNNCMADGGALTFSEMQRHDHISLKELLSLEASPNLHDLIGCVFWLREANQIQRHPRSGPNKNAHNHPCLLVDAVLRRVDEVQMFRICIVTSFKHTSPEKKAIALHRRRLLVPILPNSTVVASTLRLQLQSDITLRRDSWVNLAQTFVVEATMIKSYDHNPPSMHYKLTRSSIAAVRMVLGLTDPYTTAVEAAQGNVVHTASQATAEPSLYTRQGVGAAGHDQLSDRTILVGRTLRRSPYGAVVHTFPDVVPRNEEIDEEAHQRRRILPKPARLESERSKESLLLRIHKSLPSWKRVRSWLPSGQAVTAMVVTALLVAAAGGAVYGGYLLMKIIYTAMSGCYRDVAAVGAKVIASIVGVWKRLTRIPQAVGLGVVKGEGAICGVLNNIIAFVKALLGRH